MPLSVGDKLGPYEIVAPIGAGGMGEVYRARDTRLGRDVAIKISHGQFTERFEREARAIATLNHPNICTLHDVGPNYLVMELIEGAPLKGPLPLGQALKFSEQILDALDAAHQKGITHRDLKPANIVVTKTGIKLLDFGLAKFGRAGESLKDGHAHHGAHRQERNRRHPLLHVAGTVAGASYGSGDRRAQRYFFLRPGAVRNDHRQARL